jgi:hypothetical protein
MATHVELPCPFFVMLNLFQYLGGVDQVQILKRVQDDGCGVWLTVVESGLRWLCQAYDGGVRLTLVVSR